MNKIPVALLACCLTLSGTLAFAQGTTNNGTMNTGTMSSDSMDKGMTNRDAAPRHAVKHKKPREAMRAGAMEDKKPDSMQRVQ